MGTRIEAVATATGGRWLPRGALHLSDVAARTCLRRADRKADELDLLVNAGIYKDHNIAEPALAAIIQEDLGANPGRPPRRGRHGTFSFDVMNGGCGVLTAVQLVDGFVGAGTARLGMVVAADADPAPRTTRGFRFSSTGGALLLSHRPDPTGFCAFAQRTYPEDADLFAAAVRWIPRAGMTRRGRNVLEIREAPMFGTRCATHAIEVAAALLAAHEVTANQLDLLIANPYPPGFATTVAHGLGVAPERTPLVPHALSSAYTAGPLAALERAAECGLWAPARKVLFVSAAAGITIAAALYLTVAPGS